jgi:hypothetical protein
VKFQTDCYGADITRILESNGGGHRAMPLVHAGSASGCFSNETCTAIEQLAARSPVLSGLYLYCNCWDEAHEAADKGETPENYFWHAIVHRQEPDPGNAAYWFRKTANHPVFPRLRKEAAALGYAPTEHWDPFAFIEFCQSGSSKETATRVQLAEWQLLFDYCARERIA